MSEQILQAIGAASDAATVQGVPLDIQHCDVVLRKIDVVLSEIERARKSPKAEDRAFARLLEPGWQQIRRVFADYREQLLEHMLEAPVARV